MRSSAHLYGVVEPETGKNFCLVRVSLRLSAARGRIRFLEFTHLNSQCFQFFLELVSQAFRDDLLIIQLDNGGFHKAKKLQIPHNIILMFQPPHCPESNAIEQVWSYLKTGLRWKTPADLDELRTLITHRLLEMTDEVIASITGRAYVLKALSVVNI